MEWWVWTHLIFVRIEYKQVHVRKTKSGTFEFDRDVLIPDWAPGIAAFVN